LSALTPAPEVIEYILGYFSALDMQYVSFLEVSRRTLTNSIHAELPLPPFDASSVDDFAVRSDDVKAADDNSPITLLVVADMPAGNNHLHSLQPGEAIRIMIGAMMPPGADGVAMVEDTDYGVCLAGTPLPKQVKVLSKILPGENIHPCG